VSVKGALLATAVASLVLIPLAGGAGMDRPGTRSGSHVERDQAPGELIVRFREGVTSAEQTRTVRAEGGRIARSLRLERTKLVRLTAGESVGQAVAALEADPDVAFAEPNLIRHASALPNDSRFSQLWALNQPNDADIDAPQAWNTTTGSSNVVVAVIDTGVAYDHPDLAGNMWTNLLDPVDDVDNDGNGKVDDVYGWDFIQNDNTPLDFYGHGSHVAGTIGAQGNNALGVIGVNWDVSLMALRAGDAYGGFPLDETVDAIAYACAHGARVVNGSYGGGSPSSAEQAVISAPACANTLFVFAAGNESSNNQIDPSFPCSYPSRRIICVAASTKTDALAFYSNFGKGPVDIAAPGGGGGPVSGVILSTVPDWQPVGDTEGFENPGWPRWGNLLGTSSVIWNRSGIAHAGDFSLSDSPASDYVASSNVSIGLLDPIDLTGLSGCLVAYDMRLETELDDDFFVIRAGPTTAASAVDVTGWSGDTGHAFEPFVDDLSGMDGEGQTYLRFFLESDGDNRRGDGAFVDELDVWCLVPAADEYDGLVGTSMAAPQVAGAAALVLAAKPGLTTARLRAALLNSVDRKAAFAGKVASGGRLNVAKALRYTAPDTRLLSGPGGRTTLHKATFKLMSTAVEAHFQCKLDRHAWKRCSATKTYLRLARGRHTFRARSIDAVGNIDPKPLVRSWRIA
jgi:subtilisin family serine protease